MDSAKRAAAVVAVTVVALGGCAQVIKPPPPQVYTESATGFDQLAPELRSEDADILFFTDRKIEVDDGGQRTYGIKRSTSLAYDSAIVRMSAGADWEDLVAWTESREGAPTGGLATTVVSFEGLGRLPETPYLFELDASGKIALDPDVEREVASARAAVADELRRRLDLSPEKVVNVYVHGIQTRFVDTVVDVARIWHLGGRIGVPIAYSWPAGQPSVLSAYAYDRESSEFTIPHLKQVFRTLAAIPEVEKVNVFAHSRGTDVVTSALRELFIEARATGVDAREEFKIENLVLVAPDLDVEVFQQRFGENGTGFDIGRVTIYVSDDDTAIAAARALFSSRARLGSLEPEQLSERQVELVRRAMNIDFIVYTGRQAGDYGHGYFRNPAFQADAILLVRDGREPGSEHGRPLEPLGNHFWKIGDDYLR